MTNLHEKNTIELVDMLRSKQVSSVELLQHFVSRIEQYDTAVNAIVATDLDRAMTRAKAADDALARGESWGALHGLPMTIKDTYELVGMTTTAGARSMVDYRPTQDADAVRRLKDAGAIIFGKTNTPPYAMDVQTYNAMFGVTNNPWNLEHTSGGSSGGSAAAVAAGYSTIEVGSDIAGSIRTPAHYCGVYGHKPTHGIISLHGHIPGPPGTKSQPDLAVGGPIARSAEDLALGLSILAGADTLKSKGWQLHLPQPRHQSLKDYRVAVWLDDETCQVDVEMRTVLETAVSSLKDAGVNVTETKPVSMKGVLNIYYTLLASITGSSMPKGQYEALLGMKGDYSAIQAQYDLPGEYLVHIGGLVATHRQWLGANARRAKMQYQLEQFFEQFDVLLCPVTPTTAPVHNNKGQLEERKIIINGQKRPYVDQFPWIALATMAGLPATSAPVGISSNGLPVNMQIIGPYLEDYTPIKFAELLAVAHDGIQYPDMNAI